jgi:hypothetical protein
MSWRLEHAPTNRAPARCVNNHVHEFAADGVRFAIYGQEASGRRFSKLRIKMEPPYCNADVKHCVACGMPLMTIEAGPQS